jgi:transcriptional regulator with XRE-family HTH domain
LDTRVVQAIRVQFASLCRDTRVMLDISQRELADAAGASRSLIAAIETGQANPSLDVVMRIGDALGLDLQLVGRPPVARGREARFMRDVPGTWIGGYASPAGRPAEKSRSSVIGLTAGSICLYSIHALESW